jgi:hypothetical protein
MPDVGTQYELPPPAPKSDSEGERSEDDDLLWTAIAIIAKMIIFEYWIEAS